MKTPVQPGHFIRKVKGPVVLTESQVEQFHSKGYVKCPSFFTPREVSAMREELNRLRLEGLLRNVATDGDGTTHSKQMQNLQICPISPESEFFRAFQFHHKVIDVIGRLIGVPFVFYLDQIFLKPGGHGIGTDWHQDNAYFKIKDPTKGVALWTAIHEANLANGTLHVIPGSHKHEFDHSRDPNSDHHIHCKVREKEAIPLELPAGGVGFFNFGIAHCTRKNTTATERAGLAVHFLHTDYIPQDRVGTKALTHLTGPLASGGVNEYGKQVAGTWQMEVDRVLGV